MHCSMVHTGRAASGMLGIAVDPFQRLQEHTDVGCCKSMFLDCSLTFPICSTVLPPAVAPLAAVGPLVVKAAVEAVACCCGCFHDDAPCFSTCACRLRNFPVVAAIYCIVACHLGFWTWVCCCCWVCGCPCPIDLCYCFCSSGCAIVVGHSLLSRSFCSHAGRVSC
jgi:hypothetical protein